MNTEWGKVEPLHLVTIKIKLTKLHPDAVIPKYSKPGDAGLDFTAIDDGTQVFPPDSPAGSYFYLEYKTGIAIEIPPGYVGLCFPRSSQSLTGLIQANCVGVIDSGYRGPINWRFKIDGAKSILNGSVGLKTYKKGDRIGQLVIVPIPQIEFVEVDELSPSERGTSGWGSSGA